MTGVAGFRRAPSHDARAAGTRSRWRLHRYGAICRLDGRAPRWRPTPRSTLVADSVDPELASDCRVVTVRALRRLPMAGGQPPLVPFGGSGDRADRRRRQARASRAAGQPRQPDDLPSPRARSVGSRRARGRPWVRRARCGKWRRDSSDGSTIAPTVGVVSTCASPSSPSFCGSEFRLLYGEPRDGAVLFPPTPPFRPKSRPAIGPRRGAA